MLIPNGFESALISDNPIFLFRLMAGLQPIGLIFPASGVGGAAYNKVQDYSNEGYSQIPSAGIFGYSGMRFNGMTQALASFMPYVPANIPLSAMTLVSVISALRVTGSASGNPSSRNPGYGVVSCLQNGGYGLYSSLQGKIEFWIHVGGTYNILPIDNNLLSIDKNLMHCTFDGASISIYLNGSLVTSMSLAQSGAVINSSSGWAFGADSSGPYIDQSTYADVDISNVAVYAACLSPEKIAAHYQAWSQVKTIAGTATLDNGNAVSSIIITDVLAKKSAVVTPAADGTWSAAVPAGSYFVGAMGPTGYRPLAHGPIVVN